ncbi:uncharacterized protein LOC123682213 [Harmonia axyridis]|uniref:uncharacterized protein LOC123682213 n=1 Tax=Harmonia axyridis TaxID=115357 RepID=UPI001E27535A|nr:uncharacterized protein LOC123682213 [Harmonia axyridis]
MFLKKILLLAIFGVLFSLIASAPQMLDETSSCFGKSCPPRTTGCKKVTKTTDDKQIMEETIVCMDIRDQELERFSKQMPNPYGPNTHYESSSFTGSYTFTSGGSLVPISINTNNNLGGDLDDNVETF